MRSLAARLARLIPAVLLLAPALTHAAIFAQLRGIVHDPQHRPIPNAEVTLRAAHSALTLTTRTGPDGAFTLPSIPLGDYTVTAAAPTFAPLTQPLTLSSPTTAVLHLELALPSLAQSTTVTHTPIITIVAGSNRTYDFNIDHAMVATFTLIAGRWAFRKRKDY